MFQIRMKQYIVISWLAAAGLCLPSQENTTTTSPGRAVRSAERGCPAHCRLPTCSCGTSVPGGLSPDTVPQFVLLTFDDAVNELNREFYSRLFDGRTNPDGCPVAATMFVSHEWTDYAQVLVGFHLFISPVSTTADSGSGEGVWDVYSVILFRWRTCTRRGTRSPPTL